MRSPDASEVYQPTSPNSIINEPFEGHFPEQGYSIGYETGPDQQSVPEGGNTAIFRIFPYGVTEPVFVTKPEDNAAFTVNVISGTGALLRSKVDGTVEQLSLHEGTEVVIKPGEAYSYQNTSDKEDLVLHDVALPAFKSGDDVDLRLSLVPSETPAPPEGYSSVVAQTQSGELRTIDVPTKFFELVGNATKHVRTERQRQQLELVSNFFETMRPRLAKVPELQPVLDLTEANPEITARLYSDYVKLVERLSQLTPDEMAHVQTSWDKLMSARTGANSASKHNALDILARLDETGRRELASEAYRSFDTDSPYFEAAASDFVARTEGGHQLKASGKVPVDGDPAADKVIWGHTQITDPETLLHFTMAHYLERYFSQTLAAQGVEFASNHKDYFLNAMTDVLMLDHFSNHEFDAIFERWTLPRDEGGLGWIKQDRIQAYAPTSE